MARNEIMPEETSTKKFSCQEPGCDFTFREAQYDRKGFQLVPLHCTGSVAFGAPEKFHHGRYLNQPCWKCGGHLGCDSCQSTKSEILCDKCLVWGTVAALVQHGPLINTPQAMAKRGGKRAPQIGEYPLAYQKVYRRTAVPLETMMPKQYERAVAWIGKHDRTFAELMREPGEEG